MQQTVQQCAQLANSMQGCLSDAHLCIQAAKKKTKQKGQAALSRLEGFVL